MNDICPEHEFITKGLAGYDGMEVREYTFCKLENYNGDLQDYTLDLITRQSYDKKPLPVVFFIHGGGFLQPHDKRQGYISIFARELTRVGYAVVSPDYPIFDNVAQRSAWNATMGADRAAEAVHLAYLYIRENAERLNLDADRIALMGGSAGGMTGFYLLGHYNDNIRAFINCWGAPQGFSPCVSGFPPTLSIHGTADTLVRYELELPIQADLEKAGVVHELITLEGAGHTPMKFFATYIQSVIDWLDKYMKTNEI